MLLRFILVMLNLILAISANGQNLVLNGSFEDTSSCPISSGDLDKAIYWLEIGSPDLFNSCNSNLFSVPTNTFGDQLAYEGESYAFFASYFGFAPGFREYVIATLVQPLEETEYYLEFYVNLPEDMNASIDEIGALFSVDSKASSSSDLINIAPNIESPTGEFFNDTTWTKISGCFNAEGNEGYLIIGNFKNDANSNIQIVGGPENAAGLYIDMVQLYEIPTLENLELQSICQQGDSIYVDVADISEVVTYQWSPMIGVSDPTSPKSWVNPTQTAAYTITQTTPCGSYQTIVDVIVSQDYCSYLEGYQEFQLYPNPNNGSFTLDYTLGEESDNQLYIYNSIGKIVKTIELQGGFQQNQTIELSQLGAGMYIYKLWINGNEIQTEKMVVTE